MMHTIQNIYSRPDLKAGTLLRKIFSICWQLPHTTMQSSPEKAPSLNRTNKLPRPKNRPPQYFNQLRNLTFCLLMTIALGPVNLLQAQVGEPPFLLPAKEELAKLQSAIIYTSKGNIYLELFPQDAPWHVANFKYLADKGFYRNLKFHLHFLNYIIQGGSPDGKPSGTPGYSLPAEFSTRRHEKGTLGMARQPDYVNPQRRSNGSQFHLVLSESPQMDGSYTIFGQVIKGMEVAFKLRKGDTIRDVRVFVRPNRP